ncbi:MAG: hypothetical protein RL219_190 [Actinomycetota bacterium]
MADEPTPEPQPKHEPQPLPDLRVVSIIHDADNDRLGVSYDDDDLDPYHALGLLIAGAFRQLVDLADTPDLEDVLDDGDED